MPLTLIAGPPNSGRTGAILDAFRAALPRDPILVVPTLDDTERFEEELTGGGSPLVGATVCTFDGLFAAVAGALGVPSRPALTPVQRRRIAAEAAARVDLVRLRASSSQPGFASALEQLISELQAAGIDPRTFGHRAGEAGAYELEVAALYEAFCGVRDELGREDSHGLAAAATSALRSHPDAWGSRPVLLYGFDDLTAEQLELVRELCGATEVTVALPYEDRAVLTAARGALYAELREIEGARVEHLETNPAFTRSRTLFEIERRFAEEGAEAVPNDGGLRLLASAGELGEAETIGSEVARLLDADVPPGEIAIVVRDPAAAGPLLRRVLGRFDIPVAVQADLPVTRTLTGTGLIALLRAAGEGGLASDVLAYLRIPGMAGPDSVDWLERRVLRRRLRTAEQALDSWETEERPRPPEFRRLREAADGAELLREAGRQARWLAERSLRGEAAIAGEDRALELRAGAELERSLSELAELELPHSRSDVIRAASDLRVPMWRGPTRGRVRVISPYRARARRVGHMFIASLQDGDFPRRDTSGPLLSDEARSGLQLPPRKQAEVEDRYLFSALLSRPKRNLWLSWKSSDDEGAESARSPFVDEVRDLLTPALPDDLEDRDEALFAEARGRGLADSVFPPGDAPTIRELARSAAARPAGGLRDRVSDHLDRVAARIPRERLLPGPLGQPEVLALMREQRLFGPSTLEEYATCPYRWFVNHELKPRDIEPEGEALAAGSVAHMVLEELYRDPPGGEKRATAETLPLWLDRARELLTELGAERLPSEHAETAATRRRVEGLVAAFLRDEAAAGAAFAPDAELTEASFGFTEEEGGKPPLQLAGGGIHGRIDRIDIGPGGEALVQDYKSGATIEGGAGMLEKGKLQLQLYMLAARELWGLDLAGGLYIPLGGTSKRARKGLLRKALKPELAPLRPRDRDHLEDERFEAVLGEARARAEEIIADVQAGRVGRDPIGGSCPKWCDFQPICRRERGLPEEEPESEDEPELME